jgi:hypothetical protein
VCDRASTLRSARPLHSYLGEQALVLAYKEKRNLRHKRTGVKWSQVIVIMTIIGVLASLPGRRRFHSAAALNLLLTL